MDVPAIDGFDAEPDLLRAGTLDPLTRVRHVVFCEVREHGRVHGRLDAGQVGRVRLKAEGSQRGHVVACQLRRRDGDPLVRHLCRVGLRLRDFRAKSSLSMAQWYTSCSVTQPPGSTRYSSMIQRTRLV